MRKPFHAKLSLVPERAALLMIDIQEEQKSDPNYRADQIDRVLDNGAAMLEAARSGGWPVAHAQYVRDFSVEPQRPFEPIAEDGQATFSDASSGQTDICEEVRALAGEPVFVKNDASAFKGTQLKNWLRDKGVEWIFICGVWTEACIAATVRDGIAEGFRVMLVKDACGSGTRFMHESAILNLANRLYGGGVCDTDRARSLLAGDPATVWRMTDPVPFRFANSDVSTLYDSL